MEQLYQAAGLRRQTFHEWMIPSERDLERTPEVVVLNLACHIRQHFLPGSSAREIYHFIRQHPEFDCQLRGWGKHSFEAYCLEHGLRVISMPFKPKTTIRGTYCFPNLIEGMTLNNINAVWVSDIAYIFGEKGNLLGYATSLIDLYSRFLLGLQFSQTMKAVDTVIPVLKQAFKERKNVNLEQTIFHSDAGKQYIQKQFLAMLKTKNMSSSMAECCYENAHAEAFNDTLKNHMLADRKVNSFTQLKKEQSFIKKCYNHYKPHTGIGRLTPKAFEQQLLNLKPFQRTNLVIKVIE